jgi:hypothetical protein
MITARGALVAFQFSKCPGTKANSSQGFTRSGANSNRVLSNATEIVDRASKRPRQDGDESSGGSVEGALYSLFLIGFYGLGKAQPIMNGRVPADSQACLRMTVRSRAIKPRGFACGPAEL